MSNPHLNIAVEAARRAGDIALRYRSRLEGIPVERKARHDYVSDVDRGCEQAIREHILKHHRDHAILGEEGGQTGDSDHVWIVDPIDGTSNYLRGIPHFAISIALQVRGRIEAGVVYDPMREEMFTASRGQGAFLNSQRMRVSGRKELATAVVATAFPFRQRRLMEAYQGMFDAMFDKVEDFRRAGTASLDLAYVACGRLDGYWELNLKPWDIAAGALLVQEAGGVVMDVTGGDQWLQSGHILAAPFKLITPMRAAIEPHVTEGIKARVKKQAATED
ncbi:MULTISPECIES: inositol monophosphatase family protein [unclassified Wenzhouxiangella]|uniref:inositol monophosphatase family protein n=1 Tax=unclassified Wenzhouxiangella TaxID=2613841 RepID=UPI000E327FE4|nr:MULTISPECIES: inositol monophosphatase family protein [unclassified Wenzhouxiangella]RFF27586.1 inositol monophosphatase [Wenzhouxiangella sp. 15181]RFP70110.1 inositol monophosphatase [Wenzhouxiangella sp. 15190]